MTPANWHEIGRLRAADDSPMGARAEDVLSAIEHHRDFTLVEMRLIALSAVPVEVFIVTCNCDGVPTRNRIGIKYAEPLAIVVSSDSGVLPQVRAVRRDFPVTPHQNAVPDGEPAALCLYDQKPIAVLRTWTAPAFLRKIQWWLTETAHERLHQPDQPVEQLFFDSPDEIILPAGYLAKVNSANTPLILTDVMLRYQSSDTRHERPAHTLILGPPNTPVRVTFPVRLVTIALGPITHGAVERTPSTLGGLEDQLRARGGSVMDTLIGQIKQQVGDSGCAVEKEQTGTILLLATPVRRTASDSPEQLQMRAFWIHTDLLSIGEAAGALLRTPPIPPISPRYYIDHRLTGTPPNYAWRKLELYSLNVQALPSDEGARRMSGTLTIGPRGVLAGAGALGSMLIDLWRRAGWGQWDVIDPDHLQPHNLIRHTTHYLGIPKAEAVTVRDQEMWHDPERKIGAVVADAQDLKNPTVKGVLEHAEVIVDATTTVEVPRRLANSDFPGRVVSTFLTPTGSDAVMIAEDAGRDIRIDALEAQYWRAVVTKQWGERHLTTAPERFTSGASCRDVSLVMPYSTIVAHAATLSQQIQALPMEALIRIWQRDGARGGVAVHDVPIREPIRESFPGLTVVWDRGTLEKVRALRETAMPAETGGVLVGYHDLNEGLLYVVDALEAPPDSMGTPESFERGVKGLRTRVEQIGRHSVGQIVYLGEWHSHPPGYTSQESDKDVWQLLYLGDVLRAEDLPALMLIVAEDDYRWLISA
jgi:integrative and conjugative element protein (TIGR02256 family)